MTLDRIAFPRPSILDQAKRTEDMLVKEALGGITNIVPRIHRITLSGGQDALTQFKNLTGVTTREARNPEHKCMPLYSWIGYGRFNGHRFILYESPANLYLPAFMIKVKDLSPTDMVELSTSVPGLMLSAAEYTIDFMCRDQPAVSRLYHHLIRYCHFPRKGFPVIRGGEFEGLEVNREWNSVYHVPNRGGKGKMNQGEFTIKDYVIYERGPDRIKEEKGWHIKDVDRVRYEVKVKGKTKLMQSMGLNVFERFAQRPEFKTIMEDRIRFRAFSNSSQLPPYGFPYTPLLQGGVPESYQQIYVESQDRVKNLAQYAVPTRLTELHRKKIIQAMVQFDEDWKEAVVEEL